MKEKWLTSEHYELMRERDNLLLKASKSNDDNDIKEAHKKRNYVSKVLKKAKRDFYKEKIDVNYTDSKK